MTFLFDEEDVDKLFLSFKTANKDSVSALVENIVSLAYLNLENEENAKRIASIKDGITISCQKYFPDIATDKEQTNIMFRAIYEMDALMPFNAAEIVQKMLRYKAAWDSGVWEKLSTDFEQFIVDKEQCKAAQCKEADPVSNEMVDQTLPDEEKDDSALLQKAMSNQNFDVSDDGDHNPSTVEADARDGLDQEESSMATDLHVSDYGENSVYQYRYDVPSGRMVLDEDWIDLQKAMDEADEIEGDLQDLDVSECVDNLFALFSGARRKHSESSLVEKIRSLGSQDEDHTNLIRFGIKRSCRKYLPDIACKNDPKHWKQTAKMFRGIYSLKRIMPLAIDIVVEVQIFLESRAAESGNDCWTEVCRISNEVEHELRVQSHQTLVCGWIRELGITPPSPGLVDYRWYPLVLIGKFYDSDEQDIEMEAMFEEKENEWYSESEDISSDSDVSSDFSVWVDNFVHQILARIDEEDLEFSKWVDNWVHQILAKIDELEAPMSEKDKMHAALDKLFPDSDEIVDDLKPSMSEEEEKEKECAYASITKHRGGQESGQSGVSESE